MSQQGANNPMPPWENVVRIIQQGYESSRVLGEQNEELNRQVATIRQELHELEERRVQELAERDATIAMFVRENGESMDRLASFTRERDGAREERDAALAAAASLRQERDDLVAERDAAREHRDALQHELDASRDDNATFQRERAAFNNERDSHARERTEWEARAASTQTFMQQTWGIVAALPIQPVPQPADRPQPLRAISGPSARPRSPAQVRSPPPDRRRQSGDPVQHKEAKPSPQAMPPTQQTTPASPPLPAWMTTVPKRYRDRLPLPLPAVEVDDCASSLLFTRKWLGSAEQISGNHEGVNVKVAPEKAKFGITNYYVVNLQGNPWMPRRSGESGWMFVGLNERDQELGKGEVRELFLKFATNQHGYLGTYRCTREEDLSSTEFSQVNWAVKHSTGPAAEREKKTNRKRFCKWTASKKGEIATDADALRGYETGTIRVPCIRLVCVGFNDTLFNFLYYRHQEDASKRYEETNGRSPDSSENEDESNDNESDADYSDGAPARRTRRPPGSTGKRKRRSGRKSAAGVLHREESDDEGPRPSQRRRKGSPFSDD